MRASLQRFMDHYDCRATLMRPDAILDIEGAKRSRDLPEEVTLLAATNAVVERLGILGWCSSFTARNCGISGCKTRLGRT